MNKKRKGPFSSLIKWFTKRTNTEKIVWACLVHGFLWVDCSYLLAWANRTETAQDLSKQAVTEIIGVVLIYAVKEGSANFSKFNSWPDKSNIKEQESNSDEGRTI